MATSDDYSNNSSTTGILGIGTSTSGSIEVGGDSDWFKAVLQAGTTYVFSMTGAAQGGGTLASLSQINLFLHSDDVFVVGPRGGIGSIAGLQFTPTVSGSYFLEVKNGDSPTSSPGSYTVALNLPSPDEFSADINTTGGFDANGIAKGAFQLKSDQDWIKFHADVGKVYLFNFSKDSEFVVDGDMQLHDASGKLISTKLSLFEPATSGDYFIALRSNNITAYTVTMKQPLDDYSATDAFPGVLAQGGQATGALQYAGDIDRFSITVEAGKYYTYQLTGALADQQYLQLNSATAIGVPSTSETSRAANGALTMTFSATQSGTYSLNVSSFGLPGGVTHGNYTLTSMGTTVDDYGNTAATATAFTIGSTIRGAVQSNNDIDAFTVALQAGVSYEFDFLTSDGSAFSNIAPSLQLSKLDGSSVGFNHGPGAYAYTAPTSGTYLLQLTAISNLPLSYTLKTALANDDYGASADLAGHLTLGTPLKATLEAPTDRDWFGVELDAGTTYWITLAGAKEGGGTLSFASQGAIVKLLDASGAVLTQVQGNGTTTAPLLPYVPKVKGTYYVEVGSGGTVGMGSYTLQVSAGTTDDHGNDQPHATALANGVALAGALEIVPDLDVFRFSAQAGTTVAIELTSSVLSTQSHNFMTLGLATLSLGSIDTRNFIVDHKLYRLLDITKSGDYYLTVASEGGGKAAPYTISTTVLADDYTANVLTTALLTPTAPVHGVINYADDRDWIRVHLDAGKNYVLNLNGSLGGGGGLDTTYATGMSLYTDAGAAVGSTIAAYEPRIAYTPTATGDYYIAVNGGIAATGSYTVSATQTSDDASAPLLTSGPAAYGVGLPGNIELGFSEAVLLGRGVLLKDINGVLVPLEPVISGTGNTGAITLGTKVVLNPATHLSPGMTYTVEMIDGSVTDLAGNHYAGPVSYAFTTQGAVAQGGAGNDILVGKSDGQLLSGGTGIDTAIYAGPQIHYDIKVGAGGQATVKANAANIGDTLVGIERLMFDTTALALDIDGNAGHAYRLYQAAFNRTPDAAGLGYWIAALDKGASRQDMASAFVGSGEFVAQYGSASSDAVFVNLLYNNVLHRAGDPGGTGYWLQALHDGTSRADVLSWFGESAENQAALVGVIGNGFAYTPYA